MLMVSSCKNRRVQSAKHFKAFFKTRTFLEYGNNATYKQKFRKGVFLTRCSKSINAGNLVDDKRYEEL